MASKKEIQLAAAIDVGSNYLRMSIAEIYSDGQILMLENLVKPTNIGKDTFASGRIAVHTIHETCNILKGFAQLMKDYRVKYYKAVATSGIREAENSEYILEQIRIYTGINVEIINSAEERFYVYKALRNQPQSSELIGSQSSLIVNITSGGIEVSIYESGNLKFTEYIKLGSLRLREILSDLETMTIDFPGVMEEFIKSKIYLLESTIKNMKIKNFIGLGGELNTIYGICNGSPFAREEKHFIEKEALNKLYTHIRRMSNEQIMDTYDVSRKEGEILLPSIILFHTFLKLTDAGGIYTPMISLRNGLLSDMVDEMFDTQIRKESLNDIISSVWYIAEKYAVDKKHAAFVEKIALSIFDQTWKLHRLGERERLYLQVASILHDSGNYVNFSEHDIHSYNIIRIRNIMGLSNRELTLIANIAMFHANEIPTHSHANYVALETHEKIIVSKLSAILKLAESLDISHNQKISRLEVSNFGENKLVFILYSSQDILLEEWDFRNHSQFFEEVMGMEPILKHKG